MTIYVIRPTVGNERKARVIDSPSVAQLIRHVYAEDWTAPEPAKAADVAALLGEAKLEKVPEAP